MNTIFIHDLRVEARIGVYDWEKHLPQTVRLDLVIAAPSELPFQTGRIADALDYAKLVARIKAFARDAPPPLLERFADKVAQLVMTEFGAPGVRVRVAKLGVIAAVREIGIEIERGSMPARGGMT
jgi:dihydroneopterin aldolase